MTFLVEGFKERHYGYLRVASGSGGFTRARLLFSVSHEDNHGKITYS